MIDSVISSKRGLSLRRVFIFFICIYVVLLPIGTGLSGIIGSVSLMNYFAVAILASGIVLMATHGSAGTISKDTVPTILYFVYTIISIIWSSNTVINWYVLTNITNFLLLVVLNTYKWNKKELATIEKSLAVSQLIVVWAVLRNIATLNTYRLSITVVSTIGISDFACGLCLIIALWMNSAASSESKWTKLLAYLAIAFDFAVILMAGSRGALVMFAAMVVVWVLLGDYSRRSKLFIIVMIVIALVFFDQFFMQLLPKTITSRLTFDAVRSSRGSGRYNVWYLAWDIFKDSNLLRILFGYGFNSFLDTVQYGNYGGNQNLLAHNVIIQTMIEGGVFGLFFLIRMIMSQIKMAWIRDDGMMKIAIIGLIVAALSIDMQVTRIWGFILAFNLFRCARGEINGKEQ